MTVEIASTELLSGSDNYTTGYAPTYTGWWLVNATTGMQFSLSLYLMWCVPITMSCLRLLYRCRATAVHMGYRS